MYNFIIIVGLSATGKTTLALTYKDYMVIHTDDYIKYKTQAPYYINKTIRAATKKIVVEGVGCYKYLNDMFEYGFYKPDLIINCTTPKDIRTARLNERKTLTDDSFILDNYYQKMFSKFINGNHGIEIRDVMYMHERQN